MVRRVIGQEELFGTDRQGPTELDEPGSITRIFLRDFGSAFSEFRADLVVR